MGGSTASEVIGVFAAIVTVAAIAVIITNGGQTAKVITAAGNVFTNSLRVATRGGQAR